MQRVRRRPTVPARLRSALAVVTALAAVLSVYVLATTAERTGGNRSMATSEATEHLGRLVQELERVASQGASGAPAAAERWVEGYGSDRPEPLADERELRSAVDRARTTATLGGPDGTLLLLATPVYEGAVPAEVADRRAQHRGFVVAEVDPLVTLTDELASVDVADPPTLAIRHGAAAGDDHLVIEVADHVLVVGLDPAEVPPARRWALATLPLLASAGIWLAVRLRLEGKRHPRTDLLAEVVGRAANAREPSVLLPRLVHLLRDRLRLAAIEVVDASSGHTVFAAGATVRATSSGSTFEVGLPNRRRPRWTLRMTVGQPVDEVDLDELGELAPLMAVLVDQAQAAEERRNTAEALEHRDERRQEFLGEVSHELRNTVGALAGLASLLDSRWDALPDEDRRDLAGRVHRNAESLMAHMRDLLDLARIEREAEEPPQLSPVDLAGLTREMVDRQAPAHDCHHTRLWAPDDPMMVWGDRYALERVLQNLLDNACKYSPHGTSIDITVAPDADWVLLRVDDHGPGIPVDERERIFERFYRSPDTAEVASGTGVGLAVVKGLCESMGGSIEVTANRSGGSRFSVLLRSADTATDQPEDHRALA